MNISQLSSLAKLLTTNPNEAKAAIKLATVNILKSLGNSKYTILLDNKTLTAQSEKPLSEGVKYWAQMTNLKNSTPKLSQLLKQPLLLKNLQNSYVEFSLKDLQTILNSKKPQNILKQDLLQNLANSTSKEEFISNSTLLLSLQNQTMTIPINYHNYFSILQFKKRYNKKSKKTQIDFYAALEFLGPISGILLFNNSNVSINLNVAFEKTKQFLQRDIKNISYKVDISVVGEIEPLYNTNINSILDISI
ncbi:MAG: hypothetical protein L3J10_07805 [Sulfurimonas sp.]|nr:hypothetical protein [Sulfurimonas sp.]